MTETPHPPITPDIREVFENLAGVLYLAEDLVSVHVAVCAAAVRLVPGCDHASLMVRKGNRHLTAAASDDIAMLADTLERETGEGPCLDAIEDETPQLDPDITRRAAWPALSAQLLERTPIRGAAAFRLLVRERKGGALNLFADRAGAFDAASVDHAAVLASFASIVLMAGDLQDSVENLRRSQRSNREIGKAVGLMMAFHRVSDDQAFGILRKTSQDMNVKLSEVAGELVRYHRQRPE